MSENQGEGRTLKRNVLWEGSVGSFGIESVRLPNGRTATLAVLQHPGAVAVVPFVDGERIVMLRQYRHAARGTIWEVPAGKLDGGEDPASCAERELLEETGYRAGRLVATGKVFTTPGFSDEVIYLFCAYELQRGQSAHEAHEIIETHEMALEEALRMVDRGEIIDAKTIAALHHAERRAKSG
jgi:ADP-ribose pyrophosphatase